MAKRLILSVLVFYLFVSKVYSQVDTDFWFVAPEITDLHADRPVYLRISSINKTAKVTITEPANPSFPTITFTLNPNTTRSIDLTDLIDMLENKPENTVLNYGIYITSDNPITAYYEVLGSNFFGIGVNSDIFVLKGNHAIGREFYTPFQTHWDNYHDTPINAWSSFDIVATENNTSVTITPTKDLVGHSAGVPFTVVLQKGQTYSARALSNLALDHPSGSHITSDKPIAVTTKDDSMYEGTSYDLAGDQIIPLEYIGKEYIAIKTSYTTDVDRIYVVGTKASTNIYIDGNATPVATINAGETFEYQVLSPTVYVTASDSVYVWHVGGFIQELGGAILPPLGCTGSRQVSFTRSTDEDFFLEIVVRSGKEQYFKLNGNSTLIPAAAFSNVNGSGGVWKYAKIAFTPTSIPAGSTNIIRNDSTDFQFAIVNGGSVTGFRYGYFSDFGFLELGSEKALCQGDSIQLNAGPFQDSYLWNTGNTSQFITAKDTGTYTVTITKGVCLISDSVHVKYYPKITNAILGNDTAACANEGLTIRTVNSFSSYNWNTQEKKRSIVPKQTGNYTVVVSNEYGCKSKDTIQVTLYPVPNPKIIYNTNLDQYCKEPVVTLDADQVYSSYLWSTGDATKFITTTHNEKDYFKLTVTNSFNCVSSTEIQIDCSPVIGLIPNLLTPNDDGKNDIFYIEYLRHGTWIFEVYNRWGDRVYKNDGYDNTFDAKNLNDGIYYFSFRHKEGKGEKKGWIQIIR